MFDKCQALVFILLTQKSRDSIPCKCVSAGPVDFDSDTIQTALNELPFLGKDENFTVQSYNDTCVDITFNSDRGKYTLG